MAIWLRVLKLIHPHGKAPLKYVQYWNEKMPALPSMDLWHWVISVLLGGFWYTLWCVRVKHGGTVRLAMKNLNKVHSWIGYYTPLLIARPDCSAYLLREPWSSLVVSRTVTFSRSVRKLVSPHSARCWAPGWWTDGNVPGTLAGFLPHHTLSSCAPIVRISSLWTLRLQGPSTLQDTFCTMLLFVD